MTVGLVQGRLCTQPVSGTRGSDWGLAEGSCMGGEVTGPFSSSCSFQIVNLETGPPSSLTSYCRKKSPKTNFPGVFPAAFSGDFPASLPRAYPRFMGSFLEQSPIPQLARLTQGQCLRSDPVLPASTSILFAGPLGPEVGVGWAEGEAVSSFSSCLRGPPHPLT